jgi:hypothetical protein
VFALRCSLTPNATPVTVGMAVMAMRPMTMVLFYSSCSVDVLFVDNVWSMDYNI